MRLISYLPFLLIMIVGSLAQAAPQYSWNISVGTGVGYYGRPYVGPYYPDPFMDVTTILTTELIIRRHLFITPHPIT